MSQSKNIKNESLVSFITINYNGIKDTIELIDSIQKIIKSVSYEIIVVDNASKNEEGKLIQEKYPNITVIQSKFNLGFSGGNNLGIRVAKGDFLFFINNDTYIETDNLNLLVQHLEKETNIAGISPKIKDAFFPQKIQFAGFTSLSPITLRNKTIGQGDFDKEEFNKMTPIPYLHGAAMCLKRSAIEKVGFMPEIFFLYYEEIDWSIQFTEAGYTLHYDPCFTIYHKESQSTGNESPLRTFYMTRNRLLLAWRNRKGIKKWLSIFYLFFIVGTKNSICFFLKGEKEQVYAVCKGIWEFTLLAITIKKS